jgi:hypothetical protein
MKVPIPATESAGCAACLSSGQDQHGVFPASPPPLGLLPRVAALLPAIVIALLPKCPLCWATYMSALGIAGMSGLPRNPWLLAALVGTMALNLIAIFLRAPRPSRPGVLLLGALGTLCVLVAFSGDKRALGWLGVALIAAAAVPRAAPADASAVG